MWMWRGEEPERQRREWVVGVEERLKVRVRYVLNSTLSSLFISSFAMESPRANPEGNS